MDPLRLCAVLILAMTPISLAAVDDYYPKGYFPSAAVSQLAWAHKVNSLTELEKSVQDPHVRMIEGDVVMGLLPGGDPTKPRPIMAEPPFRLSHLDLFRFMYEVMGYNRGVTLRERKGIKLDFKEPEALKEGMAWAWVYLMNLEEKDGFPVWVNGEILVGPGGTSSESLLNGKALIEMQQANFTMATLSLGWKTEFVEGGSYSMAHFNEMANLLKEIRPTAHVTFSLRAQLALNSVENIKRFLDQSGIGWLSPSVTLVEEETDPRVKLEELEEFIKQIGANRVFVDLPHSKGSTDNNEGGNGNGSGARLVINNFVMAVLGIAVSVAVLGGVTH